MSQFRLMHAQEISPYSCHINKEFVDQLKIGDKIDHRDIDGMFKIAQIVDKKDTKLKIKYHNTNTDIWSDYNQELHRFAEQGYISNRITHRLHIFQQVNQGDFVDINPISNINMNVKTGWKSGQIRKIKCGQVQVAYYTDNGTEETIWTHFDNEEEINEFKSMCPSILYVPHLQSSQISKAIVFQYIRECETSILFNTVYQNIPTIISYKILEFYHKKNVKLMAVYPKHHNEKIKNKYKINQRIQINFSNSGKHHWKECTVIGTHNNWIIAKEIETIESPNKFLSARKKRKKKRKKAKRESQCLHVINDRIRIMNIMEHENKIYDLVNGLNWQFEKISTKDIDDSLFGCISKEIYGDLHHIESVKVKCNHHIATNKNYFSSFYDDWKLNICALSEFYYIRIQIYEYDDTKNKLLMSYNHGEYVDINLPLILLFKQNEFYHLITDPNADVLRPLSMSYAPCNPDNVTYRIGDVQNDFDSLDIDKFLKELGLD
eukprot:100935_1